ncbi:MAG: hypothetical protein RMJ97_12405, partial [Raineya sp.]|nr:hypothetical protein [Raineya sp.]
MYFTGGIRFQKLEDVLKIYKRKNMSLEAVLSFFSSASNREKVAQMYPTIKPLSVQEAISFENAEQRMLA